MAESNLESNAPVSGDVNFSGLFGAVGPWIKNSIKTWSALGLYPYRFAKYCLNVGAWGLKWLLAGVLFVPAMIFAAAFIVQAWIVNKLINTVMPNKHYTQDLYYKLWFVVLDVLLATWTTGKMIAHAAMEWLVEAIIKTPLFFVGVVMGIVTLPLLAWRDPHQQWAKDEPKSATEEAEKDQSNNDIGLFKATRAFFKALGNLFVPHKPTNFESSYEAGQVTTDVLTSHAQIVPQLRGASVGVLSAANKALRAAEQDKSLLDDADGDDLYNTPNAKTIKYCFPLTRGVTWAATKMTNAVRAMPSVGDKLEPVSFDTTSSNSNVR